MLTAFHAKRKIKMHAFDYILYALLGLFALLAVYPFVYVFFCSFSEGTDFMRGGYGFFRAYGRCLITA